MEDNEDYVLYIISPAFMEKEITQKCEFLEKIEYGDNVMADRGFTISEGIALRCACLLIPVFTKGESQRSKSEVEMTRQLARVRIHVECVIGQLRKKFKIPKNTHCLLV